MNRTRSIALAIVMSVLCHNSQARRRVPARSADKSWMVNLGRASAPTRREQQTRSFALS